MLTGVYHPERLRVIDPCRRVRGRVVAIKGEEDGDLHIRLRPERSARRLLMAANFSEQRGSLVVEFMPRDRGHLPAPRPGDRLALVGAYLEDLDHSWSELHPVWQVAVNGRRPRRSGPHFGGSPPSARSESAVVRCRTAAEDRCRGYRGPPYYLGAGGGGPMRADDRDCADFRTQAEAQRYYVSKGGPVRDRDRLDADHDGRACESLPR